MKPLISIQILNWNRADETQRAIQSALDQTYPNIEVILIDNGSTDNSVALTKSNFPNINIVELDKNYGCAGGRNMGIKFCKGDYIFFLDNDGVLHRDAVQNAYKSITLFPNIGIITGKVYDFDQVDEIDAQCSIRNDIRYEFNEFQGGISMHYKQIYDTVGYYPDHFMYGAEETYLSLKLLETKYKIIKDESVILWHKRSDVARDRTKEIISGYYNKLYVALTLFPAKNALSFMGYFLFKYPIYAKTEGILKVYIKSLLQKLPQTIAKAIKNRKPINKAAFNKSQNFNVKKLNNI
ncbi:glycosyltransferase family 2 protein [Arenibacter algicola]|uniref:glycosyltransferase family 2 protein n=1 Tax=Arenibacter algicola TaxID=616991 RepID=UPI001C072FD4|nr:glycosyltransferase family 2 protein [Arenibacter algicola]MBU2904296.1 glycosyltransferase family 2 protein [Arenibacter algicola]